MTDLGSYIDVFLTAVTGSTSELVGDVVGFATTPVLKGTHLKRVAVGGAVLGAAALAPVLYPYIAPKARSKRKKAKTDRDAAAVKEIGEIAQKTIGKAFTSPTTALPATFLLLEVLASYPEEKIVHHPEVGHWEPVTAV